MNTISPSASASKAEPGDEPSSYQPLPSAKKKKLRNPLSASTFLIRNAGKTLPLAGVIVLAVMLVTGIIALINSIPLSIRIMYAYTQESLGVSPRGDTNETKSLIAEVKKGSPVPIERVVVCRMSSSQVQSIVGKWTFLMLGLGQDDMKYYLQRQHVTSIEGRLPAAGKPEAIISAPVAQNLKMRIGSIIQGPDNSDSYSPENVKVVGIANTDRWIMVNSREYQQEYHFPPIDYSMIFSDNRKDQIALDSWARQHFKGRRVQVFTYAEIEKTTKTMFATLFTILDVVIGMLVLVITLMMGMLINIYQSQRLIEFGLLQAIGYTKKRLVMRALLENFLVVVLGWVLGLFAALGLLILLRHVLMEPRAFSLDVFDIVAYRYTIPIPITIMLVAVGTVLHRFRKFDPVAVVERRLL